MHGPSMRGKVPTLTVQTKKKRITSLRLIREWKISVQAEWPVMFDARHILTRGNFTGFENRVHELSKAFV